MAALCAAPPPPFLGSAHSLRRPKPSRARLAPSEAAPDEAPTRSTKPRRSPDEACLSEASGRAARPASVAALMQRARAYHPQVWEDTVLEVLKTLAI